MPDVETFTAAAIPEEALDPVSVPVGIFEYSEGSVAEPYVQVKTGRDFVVVDDLYVEGNCEITGDLTVTNLTLDGRRVDSSITISTDQDNLDVSNVNVVRVETGSNNVTIGGLSGGVTNQTITFYKPSTLNNLIFEHAEGVGDQDIRTNTDADLTFSKRVKVSLICAGVAWLTDKY